MPLLLAPAGAGRALPLQASLPRAAAACRNLERQLLLRAGPLGDIRLPGWRAATSQSGQRRLNGSTFGRFRLLPLLQGRWWQSQVIGKASAAAADLVASM